MRASNSINFIRRLFVRRAHVVVVVTKREREVHNEQRDCIGRGYRVAVFSVASVRDMMPMQTSKSEYPLKGQA